MSCLTLLRLLDVCRWKFVFILLLAKVEKLHIKYLLTKKTSLLILLCSFSTLFVWVCVVLLFIVVFIFFTCSFPAYCLSFCFFLFL
jgi:hypothetical protein